MAVADTGEKSRIDADTWKPPAVVGSRGNKNCCCQRSELAVFLLKTRDRRGIWENG